MSPTHDEKLEEIIPSQKIRVAEIARRGETYSLVNLITPEFKSAPFASRIVGEHLVSIFFHAIRIQRIEKGRIISSKVFIMETLEGILQYDLCGSKNKFIFCTGGLREVVSPRNRSEAENLIRFWQKLISFTGKADLL